MKDESNTALHPSSFILHSLDAFGFEPGRYCAIVGASIAAGNVAIAIAIPFHHLIAELVVIGRALGFIDFDHAASLEVEVKTESRVVLRERGANLFAVMRGCHSRSPWTGKLPE